MQKTRYTGGNQEGIHSHMTEEGTRTGQGTLEALMGLIDEAVALHLRLQVLTEELHGHSELSRACRGILQDLYRLGPRTVPQLARGRPVSRQNVLMLVNRLISEGMAESTRNPEHKRSYLVRLTPRGKALLEEMWSRETDLLNNLDLNLSSEDLQAAAQVLHRLREALENQQIDREVTKS
jgi:DNA-binding MarR family transcriptional regulator